MQEIIVDANKNEITVGDFVTAYTPNVRGVSTISGSDYYRIINLVDPWALSQWSAVLESIAKPTFRATVECNALYKVAPERAALLLLEFY